MAKEAIMNNRYASTCKFCNRHVEAGEGIYDTGWNAVTCTETVTINDNDSPWETDAQFTTYEIGMGCTCLHRYNTACKTEFADAAALRTARDAEHLVKFPPLSAEQIAANRAEARRENARIKREQDKEFREKDCCPRCFGHGYNAIWRTDGGRCYRCGGTGKYVKNTKKVA
jgi:hypothetical protein